MIHPGALPRRQRAARHRRKGRIVAAAAAAERRGWTVSAEEPFPLPPCAQDAPAR